MNYSWLRYEIAPLVRACPFGCGWEANRKLKSGIFVTDQSLFPLFISRCREDLTTHLILAHGAKP